MFAEFFSLGLVAAIIKLIKFLNRSNVLPEDFEEGAENSNPGCNSEQNAMQCFALTTTTVMLLIVVLLIKVVFRVFRMEVSVLLILVFVQVLNFLIILFVMLNWLPLTLKIWSWIKALVEFTHTLVEFMLEMHLDNTEQGGENNEFQSTAEGISLVGNHDGGCISTL